MNARKRLAKNRKLEANVYELRGYYRYKHPITGKFHSLGKDQRQANISARKLNAILLEPTDYVSRVLGTHNLLMKDLISRYVNERLPDKNYTKRTLEETTYRINKIFSDIGSLPLDALSIKVIADYLDQTFKGNSYTKHRGLLSDVFKFGISKGMVESNYALDTLSKASTDRIRLPLTLSQYHSIYQQAEPWLQIAMDIALITLQRRSDLCAMKWDQIKDDRLFLVQQKTEKHGIHAKLSIQIGSALQEVIHRAKNSKIKSPFVIHMKPNRVVETDSKEHWSQVLPQFLSKSFAKARDRVPELSALPSNQKPSFHEIRALGGHLYLEQGFSEEYVQRLMGHTTLAMTSHYTDRHEQWTNCSAELNIKTSL